MSKKKEEKCFTVTYNAEVRRVAYVTATNEEEARKKFSDGDFEEGHEVECYNIDHVCFEE